VHVFGLSEVGRNARVLGTLGPFSLNEKDVSTLAGMNIRETQQLLNELVETFLNAMKTELMCGQGRVADPETG